MSGLWWLQIAADAVLVASVVVLLLRLKRLGGAPALKAPADFERFIGEAESLSRDFDRLLAQKRELVAQTLAGLDQRLEQLRGLARELEQEKAPAPPRPKAQTPAQPSAQDGLEGFRRRVRELASQGQDPAQISRTTGRPRGEVELVLALEGQER